MNVMLRKAAGFSVIELIVIIIIIAILAVLPLFNWPGTVINISAQAKKFSDDIRYTQSLAMSKSERYRIITLSSTTYQIQNSVGTPITFPSGSTTATLNAGITFGTWNNLPNNLIAFNGQGTPYLDTVTPGTPLSSGTAYNISLTSGGNSKTINISPITGRVY